MSEPAGTGRTPAPPAAKPLVTYRREGAVGVVTIDHPPVNAFSTGVWAAFGEALSAAREDEAAHVLILTAAGRRTFSAGADVKEAATLGAAARRARQQAVRANFKALARFPLPVLCAINGPAAGGAVNLSTVCDYRIAAEGAHFSLPEINHGAAAGGGAFLTRIGVRAGVVRRLLYTGARLTATEALAVGLVDEVVPSDGLLDRALALAGEIAEKPRDALARMKVAVLAAEGEGDWLSAYDAVARLGATTVGEHGEGQG